MNNWILLFSTFILIIMSGCKSTAILKSPEETDYQPILHLNDQHYQSIYTNEGKLTKSSYIGDITKQLSIEATPNTDFHSNVLPEGTAIYEVEEEGDFYLAHLDGTDVVFAKSSDFDSLEIFFEN